MMLYNTFLNNYAEIEGGAIKYVDKPPILTYDPIFFMNNSAPYGPDNSSYPISTHQKVYSYNQSDNFAKISEEKIKKKNLKGKVLFNSREKLHFGVRYIS